MGTQLELLSCTDTPVLTMHCHVTLKPAYCQPASRPALLFYLRSWTSAPFSRQRSALCSAEGCRDLMLQSRLCAKSFCPRTSCIQKHLSGFHVRYSSAAFDLRVCICAFPESQNECAQCSKRLAHTFSTLTGCDSFTSRAFGCCFWSYAILIPAAPTAADAIVGSWDTTIAVRQAGHTILLSRSSATLSRGSFLRMTARTSVGAVVYPNLTTGTSSSRASYHRCLPACTRHFQ